MVGGLHIALCVLAIDPPEMFSSFSPSAEAHRLVFHHRLNLTISPVEHAASSRRFADCSAGVQHPSRQVCCSAACGLCGGHGCSGRPGGPRQCCMPAIVRAGRVCESRADVACILRGSSNYVRGGGVEHHGSSGAVLAAVGGDSTPPASTQPSSLAVLAAAGGASTQPASLAPMKLHPRLPPIRVKRTPHEHTRRGSRGKAKTRSQLKMLEPAKEEWQRPMVANLSGVCLSIFVCSRTASNTNANLMDVYRDRVPRWRSSPYPVYIVDSCNQTFGRPFTVPGMRTLSYAGDTSFWCSWGCPTTRETVALKFMDQHIDQTCSFIFKISGKYWTPDLIPQIGQIPMSSTKLVMQNGMKSSEIFGMDRATFSQFIRMYGKTRRTQEWRLRNFSRKLHPHVHELREMQLYNYTRRSDGRKLHWLR